MGDLRLNPGGFPEANRKLSLLFEKTGRGRGRVKTLGEITGRLWANLLGE